MASTLTSPGREKRGRQVEGCSQVVVVLGCEDPTAPSSRHLLDEVDVVSIGRGSRGATRATEKGVRRLGLRLPDPHLSTEHATLMRTRGRWLLRDAQSKNGTFIQSARITRAALPDGTWFTAGHTLFLFGEGPAAQPQVKDLQGDAATEHPGLATFAGALWESFVTLRRAAGAPVPVMVFGESGTGKELVARAVHELSRRPGAFIAVNCGALPATLLEAELFGHRRGAFSGAVDDRVGLVEAADRGTLFLDEIGDLAPNSQAAFLRVLQEQEVVPIGANRPVRVNLRVVAATHRDLDALVEQGQFRHDLHARLAGHVVRLPPLRERREDLGLLVSSILRRTPGTHGIALDLDAALALALHDWPGNIRELERTLAAAVAIAGERVELSHLPDALRPAPPELDEDDRRHRDELVLLIDRHHGNLAAVARALGKARMQVHRWVRRYGIALESFRR